MWNANGLRALLNREMGTIIKGIRGGVGHNHRILVKVRSPSSANEIDHHQMENNVRKNEIGKGPLFLELLELASSGSIHLNAQANAQNEACNGGQVARQECIEREGAHKQTVHELQHTSGKDVEQIGVDRLDANRCHFAVLLDQNGHEIQRDQSHFHFESVW